MIYLLFVGIAIVSSLFVIILCSLKGVANPGIKKLNILYKPQDGIVPYNGGKLILITIICFVIALATQISLYKNTATVGFFKLYGLLIIVLSAALVDSKRRIIPNLFVIIGLVFRLCIYCYEIFATDTFKAVMLNDLIGLAIGFGFLAIVSIITKGAIGFGDAKLFGIIGLISGSFCTYSTLLISLLLSAVISIVEIARKKMGRKDSLPFGPFIAVGYIVALLLTSY